MFSTTTTTTTTTTTKSKSGCKSIKDKVLDAATQFVTAQKQLCAMQKVIAVAEVAWKAEEVAVAGRKLGMKWKATDWPTVAVK